MCVVAACLHLIFYFALYSRLRWRRLSDLYPEKYVSGNFLNCLFVWDFTIPYDSYWIFCMFSEMYRSADPCTFKGETFGLILGAKAAPNIN